MPNQNWKAPDRLGSSSLRPVRLSGQGATLAAIAALIIVGAFVLGVFLSRKVRREAQEQSLLREQGVTVDAVITRLWRTNDKDNEPRVAYRFEFEGRIYSGSVKAPLSKWRTLTSGAKLPVQFVPSRPTVSHPVEWPREGLPPWFPYAISALLAGMGAIPAVQIARQMRLLAEGRPAPGRMTGFRKGKGMAVLYEFQVNGKTIKGRSHVSKMPPSGEPLCVLYDPENPRHSALYPFGLVRLGDAN